MGAGGARGRGGAWWAGREGRGVEVRGAGRWGGRGVGTERGMEVGGACRDRAGREGLGVGVGGAGLDGQGQTELQNARALTFA